MRTKGDFRAPFTGLGRAAVLGLLMAWLLGLPAQADDLGLRVAPGFKVSVFADETLANDIYALTLDARGRVVVTGKGYVKTLHDTDGDGKADKATLFAETATGGMGLCFDGNDLYFCGDGWFSRFGDKDGDGRADGPPERIIPLAFTEHGGHAMRKGPDGWWYVIGGNDSGIDNRHAALPGSPIRDPEAGCLLRLPPDVKGCEVVAQGFRNPYDFDFNAAGDVFTYDSDVERDYFLPWYTPTRLYHVGYAAHHGWRLSGFLRSWARRDDYLDTVDVLWPVGRGSPTGVVCYRHDRFPESYRGGVFALDWTFGKVFFFPLVPDRASYRTQAEVFIEPTGTHGFAPTDAAVAPDGSLYLSIGGRGTRGAVYRVEYVGTGHPEGPARSKLASVLDAPQPLDAWSRARWVPEARKLGPEPFLNVIVMQEPPHAGVRAVEVLTELFDGLPARHSSVYTAAQAPEVRARIAWSLGRKPHPGSIRTLATLARDSEPRVRLAALEALAGSPAEGSAGPEIERAVAANLEDKTQRVRQAAARLASRLPLAAWKRIVSDATSGGTRARLTAALATVWRERAVAIHDAVIEDLLPKFDVMDAAERLDAIRLIVLALGDWQLKDPPVEVNTGYSVQPSLAGRDAMTGRIREAVRPWFPSGDPHLDDELARLLAILEDDAPELPPLVAGFWTPDSAPTRDLHYLIVFSRLRGPVAGLAPHVAEALLALDRKLQGQELRIKQTWSDRLAEVTKRLLERDPKLAEALLRHPGFVAPGHVALALCLAGEPRVEAARMFLEAVLRDEEFAWSGPLVELLAPLPAGAALPSFRAHWDNYGLRDALLLHLAERPETLDRDKFLGALESDQPQVIRAALSSLEELPRDPSPEHLVPVLRLIRRLLSEPKGAALRSRVLALVNRQAGQSFQVQEGSSDAPSLRRAYAAVFTWFEKEHAAQAQALSGGDEDLAAWRIRLKQVDWPQGDATRGAKLFESRACQTCHTGQRALGPDLTGVATRFARDDLFTAILAPSLDVSPLYRTTVVETRDGQIHSGLVAFESADGLIVQTGAATTVRVATSEIAARQPGNRSLMPDGLLKDLKPAELADLYAYLQTLTTRSGLKP